MPKALASDSGYSAINTASLSLHSNQSVQFLQYTSCTIMTAVNDSDKFAFVVESATSIAEIICRYAVFEDVWLQYQSAAADELERALIKLYAAIMIYLSKAKRYFDENTACKFAFLIINIC